MANDIHKPNDLQFFITVPIREITFAFYYDARVLRSYQVNWTHHFLSPNAGEDFQTQSRLLMEGHLKLNFIDDILRSKIIVLRSSNEVFM